MPIHNGVQLSIISQVELATHPEYPHPESSQFTYRSPSLRGRRSQSSWVPPAPGSDSKADQILGRPSVVSVYIPSVPNTRFWLRYNVIKPECHFKYYYFKLFMNGRLITSWGVNVLKNPDGQIMRGLFQPGQSHNYRTADGRTWERGGIESRSFSFGPQVVNIANDGGLISIQVFRARGRKRRVQEPTKYKNQQLYGINLPSHDLLDRPEEATFYDWHLKDPIDTPFAEFRFHYRSWDTLKLLNLVPVEHTGRLLPPTPSLFKLQGVATTATGLLADDDNGEPVISYLEALQQEREAKKKKELDDKKIEIEAEKKEAETKEEKVSPAAEDCPTAEDSPVSIVVSQAWDATPFDDSPPKSLDSPTTTKKKGNRLSFLMPQLSSPFTKKKSDDSIRSINTLNSVGIPRSRFSSAVIDKPFSPDTFRLAVDPLILEPKSPFGHNLSPNSNRPWPAGIVGRPLPKIPTRQSSKRTLSSKHSRKSSNASSAPSITPSLLSYVNKRDSMSPEPTEIGVASIMQVVVSTPPKVEDSYIEDQDPLSDTELSMVLKDSSDLIELSPMTPNVDASINTSATATRRRGMSVPPPSAFFQSIDESLSMANVTIRKPRPASPKKSPEASPKKTPLKRHVSNSSVLAHSPLSLSPSEWLASTPSPSRRRSSNVQAYSPTVSSLRKSVGKENLRLRGRSPTPRDSGDSNSSVMDRLRPSIEDVDPVKYSPPVCGSSKLIDMDELSVKKPRVRSYQPGRQQEKKPSSNPLPSAEEMVREMVEMDEKLGSMPGNWI